MHSSSFSSSILWTSSLFDWLIQLSLCLTNTFYHHLNCSQSKWTCWIRFIFASSSNSLSIAIAWIAKSPSNSTSISYQPCCNTWDRAFLSTQNSPEHPLVGRNKRLRHLRDTSRGRISCMFRLEAGGSCKRRSLRDLPAMKKAFWALPTRGVFEWRFLPCRNPVRWLVRRKTKYSDSWWVRLPGWLDAFLLQKSPWFSSLLTEHSSNELS